MGRFGGRPTSTMAGFETLTWAAGLAAATKHHRDLRHRARSNHVHPVRAAKEIATIDHISRRPFHVDIVAGWNEPEIQMFGCHGASTIRVTRLPMVHDAASSGCGPSGFDFTGNFLPVPALTPTRAGAAAMAADHECGQQPGRTRLRRPPCGSEFRTGPDVPTLAATCSEIKRFARERYSREISVFTMGYVVCRETEREALRYRDYYVKEKGDFTAAHNLLETLIPNSQSALGDQYRAMIENLSQATPQCR